MMAMEEKAGKKSFKVVVFGRSKSGKSSLVKGLLENQQAEESSGFAVCKHTAMNRHNDIHGITVFDTPSLGSLDRTTEAILDEVAEITEGSIDLMLFCIDMRRRLNRNDVDYMREITNKYGRSVWRNAMVVLTFANEIQIGSLQDFPSHCDNIKDFFQECLEREIGLSNSVAKNIPFIPVGCYLPDCKDWENEFWKSAMDTFKAAGGSAQLKADTVCPYTLAALPRAIKTIVIITSGLFILWCCIRLPEKVLKITTSWFLSICRYIAGLASQVLNNYTKSQCKSSVNLNNDHDNCQV